MAPDAFDSPALPLLIALEARGVRVEVTPDRLIIEPASRLTTEERTAVQVHGRALAALVRVCDAGVQDRREVFRQQLEAALAPMVRVHPGVLLSDG